MILEKFKMDGFSDFLTEEIIENNNLLEIISFLFLDGDKSVETIKHFVAGNVKAKLCELNELISMDEFVSNLNLFEVKQFDNYEAAANEYGNYYHYMVVKSYIKRLDSFILDNLTGFNVGENNNVYVKDLGNDVCIKLNVKRRAGKILHLVDYAPFDIFVSISGKDFYISNSICDASFFLKGLVAPVFNYIEDFMYDIKLSHEGALIKEVKNQEPKIYCDSEQEVYLLQNSFEFIKGVNNYIFLVSKLHIYLFEIFEKWVVKNFTNNT